MEISGIHIGSDPFSLEYRCLKEGRNNSIAVVCESICCWLLQTIPEGINAELKHSKKIITFLTFINK